MSAVRRCVTLDRTVFVTLRSAGDWLRDAPGKDAVIEALRATRQRHPFHHCAHVVLDDHVHLLLATTRSEPLANCIGCCKHTARSVLAMRADVQVWMPGYRLFRVSDASAFRACLDYIHRDPVKHGLTRTATDWPWSSFAVWYGRGIYPEGWGSIWNE